jgi:hypothetical protein
LNNYSLAVDLSENQNPQDLLAEDHRALDSLLVAVLVALDGNDSVATFNRLDLFWARLAMHIRAENLHLFPALAEIAKKVPEEQITMETLGQVLDKLRADHDFFMNQLGDAVRIMRELSAVRDGRNQTEQLSHVYRIIDAVQVRLASHNRLEEEVVYRLPSKVLSVEDQSSLAVKIRRELENLPPRFAKG